MISMNLKMLRSQHQLTQEEIAEHLNVSRQAVAKWEKGDSIPDLTHCMELAKLYNISIDSLVHYKDEGLGLPIPPKGKHYFGSVTVGERGQIVIPKKARELFHILPGNTLVIVGDDERGLAIIPEAYMKPFFNMAMMGSKKENKHDESN